MSDIFKILNVLTERNVPWCFQCQGINNYYNLSVNDSKGVNHSLSFNNINEIERALKIMWGHILVSQPTFIPSSNLKPLPRPF